MIIGRMVIRKMESTIILTDEAKVTKFILVDAVGVDAAAKGIKVGDLIIAKALGNVVLDAGTVYIPICEEPNIVFFVEEVTMPLRTSPPPQESFLRQRRRSEPSRSTSRRERERLCVSHAAAFARA
jgi:hypothetical protein